MGRGSGPELFRVSGWVGPCRGSCLGKSAVIKRVGPGPQGWTMGVAWRWIETEGGAGLRFTCVGWSIVAADISGLMCVGRHHLIVVLVRAVDTHLGSPAGLAAQKLPGPGWIPYPPHPAQVPLGPQRRLPNFRRWSPETSKLLEKGPASLQDP